MSAIAFIFKWFSKHAQIYVYLMLYSAIINKCRCPLWQDKWLNSMRLLVWCCLLGIKRKSTESALAILTSTPLKDLLLGLSVLRSILKKYADHTKTMRRKYLEIGHDCIFAYSNIVRVITAEPLNTHGYSNHVCL